MNCAQYDQEHVMISCWLSTCHRVTRCCLKKASLKQVGTRKDSGDKNRLLFTLRCFWDASNFTEAASGSRSVCVCGRDSHRQSCP